MKIFLSLTLSLFLAVTLPVVANQIAFKNVQENNKEHLSQWLNFGLHSVQNSLGEIPEQSYQISIIAHPNAQEPVPWAQVMRTHVNHVKFYVDQQANYQALVDDWTIYHELSHLYLPFMTTGDLWFNEGFATYMQYIVMLQANVVNQAEFEQRMLDGLTKGKQRTRYSAGSLNYVTKNMRRMRAFKRVYWTGTAYFIEVEQTLIKQGKDLPSIIQQYGACCLDQNSSTHQLLSSLDRISETTVFSDLFQQYQFRRDFPTINERALTTIASHYIDKSCKATPDKTNNATNQTIDNCLIRNK